MIRILQINKHRNAIGYKLLAQVAGEVNADLMLIASNTNAAGMDFLDLVFRDNVFQIYLTPKFRRRLNTQEDDVLDTKTQILAGGDFNASKFRQNSWNR